MKKVSICVDKLGKSTPVVQMKVAQRGGYTHRARFEKQLAAILQAL